VTSSGGDEFRPTERRPPLTLELFVPGSAPTLVFDDESTTVVPGDEEPEG